MCTGALWHAIATKHPGTAQKRSPIVMQDIHATKHPPQARAHINMADQENVTRLQAWHKPRKDSRNARSHLPHARSLRGAAE